MGAAKFRVPSPDEEKILRRNGIDPDGVTVTLRSEDVIYLKRYKTGDEITVRQGLRGWDTYKD